MTYATHSASRNVLLLENHSLKREREFPFVSETRTELQRERFHCRVKGYQLENRENGLYIMINKLFPKTNIGRVDRNDLFIRNFVGSR